MTVVAAAVIGSAVVGGIASSSAAKKAAASNDKSTAASALAAEQSNEMVGKRLAFDERMYDEGKTDRATASDNAKRVSEWQLEDRKLYNGLQAEQVSRGRKYQDAEDQQLFEAQSYDSEARRESDAAKAMADVQQQVSLQREAGNRELSRFGIDPGSPRSLAMKGGFDIATAKLMAFAGNSARKATETQGYARKMDAIGLGKGLVGNQATQASLSLNAGNSAVNNGLVPLSITNNANGNMSAGYGNAAAGYSNSSNSFGRVAGMQAGNFYTSQAYGAKAGEAAGKLFSKGVGLFTS